MTIKFSSLQFKKMNYSTCKHCDYSDFLCLSGLLVIAEAKIGIIIIKLVLLHVNSVVSSQLTPIDIF